MIFITNWWTREVETVGTKESRFTVEHFSKHKVDSSIIKTQTDLNALQKVENKTYYYYYICITQEL